MLTLEACAEVAKPEWWNDEELKTLSAKVVRAAPNEEKPNFMRALVLGGGGGAWEAGPRSAAELKEAATHFERAAALSDAPEMQAKYACIADECRNRAGAMSRVSTASGGGAFAFGGAPAAAAAPGGGAFAFGGGAPAAAPVFGATAAPAPAPGATFAFGGGGGGAAPTFGAPAPAPTFGAAQATPAFGTPAPAPAAAAAGGFSLGATPGGTRNVRKYKRPTKK